jgi:hypothetical protein
MWRLLKGGVLDSSNVFNVLRYVWFVLTRPELFVKEMPWLQKDELDNITPR